ncbi:hypothetical protein NQD34_006100 [Periophthalmus magnuspinnatus]|nr:hypothetical protein NQD34_006100 [Periophthalmus magnuspinnatus]
MLCNVELVDLWKLLEHTVWAAAHLYPSAASYSPTSFPLSSFPYFFSSVLFFYHCSSIHLFALSFTPSFPSSLLTSFPPSIFPPLFFAPSSSPVLVPYILSYLLGSILFSFSTSSTKGK